MTRSVLYVPGDAPEKLTRALRSGADELIVDLEDAVPPDSRDAARREVAGRLREVAAGAVPLLWVRVNPGEQGIRDAAAVALPGVAGVVAAKARDPAGLAALGRTLAAAEHEHGLAEGTFGIIPLIESAGAVLLAPRLARAPRVVRLQLGEADLRAELGVDPGPDGRELLHVRSRIVLAAAAAGIRPPVAPVSTDVRDPEGLRESTRAFARLGFRGRACIHPAQIPVVNEVFTPSPEEVDRAREVVTRFREALAAGTAVCLDGRGRLIDEAVVRRARRLLATAEAYGRP
ncbi:CoA ester lyase [Streptomyces sp. CAU 1734]|uniref:HpcH/HpaI aldolase/citrate lyase family protein n=1 Tax=Streptomyces sp. CAU 1734 TaxID=3140360 RepID=UPI0032617473